MNRHNLSPKDPKVSFWGILALCILIMVIVLHTIPHDNNNPNRIATPQNPKYSVTEEIVTITYTEPYECIVQYFPSEEKVIADTEYLLMLLAEDWGNADIDISLSRGMDSVGREHLVIAKTIGDKYEIRAYQDIGLDTFAYVTASCSITDYSLGELYAGIEQVIRTYEKEHREIKPY